MSNLSVASAGIAEGRTTLVASPGLRPAAFALALSLIWGPSAGLAQEPDGPVLRGSLSAAELHEVYRSVGVAESRARFQHLAAKEALERVRTAAADAERALREIKAERPTLAEPDVDQGWKELTIGEFEPEDAFEERVAAAKKKAEADAKANRGKAEDALEAGTARWRKRVAEAERRVIDAKAVPLRDLAALEKRVEETERAAWVRSQLPPFEITVSANGAELPRFDRKAMSFRNVPVLRERHLSLRDLDESDGQLKDARLSHEGTTRVDIRCDSLATAKKFKEDAEAGRIVYAIVGDLVLEEAESPVVVQERVVETRRHVEEKSVVGGVLGAVAGAALLIASGSDGTGPNDQMVMDNMTKLGAGERKETTESVELQPVVTVPGTRLKLAFRPTYVAALTMIAGKAGVMEGVDVAPLSSGVEVTEVMETAQASIRAKVEAGDRVTAIDGRFVHTAEALVEAVRGMPAERPYTVSLRRGPGGRSFKVDAVGGRLLGLTVESPPSEE